MSEFINTIDLLGDDAVMDSIIDRTITELKDDKLTTVGAFAFYACSALSEIDLPNVGTINSASFMNCGNLTNVEMPQLTRVAGSAFIGTGLNRIHFPLVTQIDAEAFSGSGVTLADFPVCTLIAAKAFFNCSKLASLILRSTTMCTLANANALSANWNGGYGPIYNGTGYIYVPRALIDSYKTATNWSAYVDQFRILEDYTVDGTTTGEFDPMAIPEVADIVQRTLAGDYVNTTVTKLKPYALCDCIELTSVKFTNVTSIGYGALNYCTMLTRCDLSIVTEISAYAFKASPVDVLILRNSASVCSLANADAFDSTNIANGTGYIYVPSALVDSYKAATNWSTYANQIRAIEDYPDICGGE